MNVAHDERTSRPVANTYYLFLGILDRLPDLSQVLARVMLVELIIGPKPHTSDRSVHAATRSIGRTHAFHLVRTHPV